MKPTNSKIHTFSASDHVMEMLEAIAHYHQLKKSATISALIKKEFWRVFPGGTAKIHPLEGARVEGIRKQRRRNSR